MAHINTIPNNKNLTHIIYPEKNSEDNQRSPALENNNFTQETFEEQIRELINEKNKKTEGFFKDKIFGFSRLIFSRESTYRGLIDLFAEDIPAVLVEALRGKAACLEAIFKNFLSTSMIFVAPLITKFLVKLNLPKIFSQDALSNARNLMLFRREDLDSDHDFENAKSRIIKEEIQDSVNLANFFGTQKENLDKYSRKILGTENFLAQLESHSGNRAKINFLKDKVLEQQSYIEGAFWASVPFLQRLFRKYVLGVGRFTGSMKYLKDKDADKLGNQKNFTVKQIFGTLGSFAIAPILMKLGTFSIKKENWLEKIPFFKTLKRNLDTKHGYYPKLGAFLTYGNMPLMFSKIFNSQDRFELMENVIRFFATFTSLFFGDRVTNGNLAKKADKELVDRFGASPGILYEKSSSKIFPEAAKFQEVLDRTSHDKNLKQRAIELYQKTFLNGFSLHIVGTFLIKYLINYITQFRVQKALKAV